MQTPLSQKCIDLAGVDLYLEGSERGRRRSVSPVQSTDLVPPASFPRRLKKERLTRRFPGTRFRGCPPTETVLFCCLTKPCIIPPSMTVKKKTVRRSLDMAGNAEGTMTKYLAFARGGAWRSPKPTGGPYVCEQCRLDACGGNDRTLTMRAVTTIELAPADVCADCGARLLEEWEVKDRA